jgi:hypothetical protein
MKLLLTVLLIFTIPLGALAEEFRRKISLEWEEIPDAKYYDVEIQTQPADGKTKPKSFVANSAQWTGKLMLGSYTLRVRGRDRRKVPGEWSEAQEFAVGLETPQIISPKISEKISSKSPTEKNVSFKWSKVGGAESYAFELTSKDGKVKRENTLKDNHVSLSLPVAAEYDWKIIAQGPNGINSEKSAQGTFALWGPKLAKPTLTEPRNAFVRELEWDRPVYSEGFDYEISRFDSQQNAWVSQEKNHTTDLQAGFDGKYPGGKYKISLKATATLRENSGSSERVFTVAAGDRSPAAEEVATIRESIDRTTGWFGIASYLVTEVSYTGTNSDRTPGNSLSLNFNGALGGTGRVGIGYLSPVSPWGFLTVADYSGIIINNNVYTYDSLETNAVYRTDTGDKSEVRQQFGLFYKELPVIIGTSQASALVQSASAVGPHYGIEYWRAITPKFGFQANAHAYLSAASIATPNGNALSPNLSYQLGFLGSYRLTRRMTGLGGFAYRQDSVSYKASDGSTDTSTLTGNYFNLFLEWQL